MNWKVSYLPEACKDLQRIQVFKAIDKVSANPKPKSEGGYGTPLGNKSTAKLADLFKIKLKRSGLRIVYKLICANNEMLIIIVGARAESRVYIEADTRVKKNTKIPPV